MVIIERIVNSFVLWAAWIVIPLIMEIIPSIGSAVILFKRRFFSKKIKKPIIYPEISIIVPVYNSQDTLEACIRSINDCAYPNRQIRVFLVNNQGKDNSFQIFTECQKKYPDLIMQWLNANQGKSRALNLALYNSNGKYIIHIDSDGILEKNALTNMVDKFESDSKINCMTGAIMIQPELVDEYPVGIHRLFREMEFMEYAQAFLAGRNYASELNSIYTVSGAFSAFRKSAILKSRLYNTETLAEDTQITFQMRYLQGEHIYMSENSIFFVDPIESVDKLYTQRQRWQRGSLEVSKMFVGSKMKPGQMFTDVSVRTLMYDHTFAFPRIIWYLALVCLTFVGYSASTVLLATLVLFGLYTVCGYLYYFSTVGFLKDFPEVRKYYAKKWWIVPLLPFFNFVVFFIRFAGIINSINTDSAWKTKTLTDEKEDLTREIDNDFSKVTKFIRKLRAKVNDDPEVIYRAKTTQEKANVSWGWYLFVFLLVISGGTLGVVCWWASNTYSVQFNEIVTTLFGPLQGAGNDMLVNGLRSCLPLVGAILFALLILFVIDRIRIRKMKAESDNVRKEKRAKWLVISHRIVSVFGIAIFIGSLLYGNYCYDVVGYVTARLSNTEFYEKYYVNPETVDISDQGQKRNLIYIYMESMETTYASKDENGFQDVNYIPNLTKLAKENVSFSEWDGFGGFFSNYGATWTLGSIFTSPSGVPYELPGNDESMGEENAYASGLVTLGDILEDKGYHNVFLCGSDAKFGGRATYFSQHGDYEIIDYYEAIKRGYIPSGYYKWWGFEDQKLYEIAKSELSGLADKDEPFNFTMLTVDTHATDGYLCDICGDEYPQKTANVVACADKQVAEFIEWCKEQPFYENTTIVITGDHPRMDSSLVADLDWIDRAVYDCYINVPESVSDKLTTKTRQSMAFDVLPTTLAAMGYNIEGNRLGLGTNLFSTNPTLMEELGLDNVETELRTHSDYYLKTFAPELVNDEE